MQKVQTVMAILDAFAAQDAEAFASHMTEDVVLRPSAFITGTGEYRGRQEILVGFAEMLEELEKRRERVRVKPTRHYLDEWDEDKVLTLAEITITRESGETFGTDIAYLWSFEGDEVVELDAWLDHAEGLRKLGSPIEA